MQKLSGSNVGISGISVYVPSPCVRLRDWCRWTKQSSDKLERNIGRSFRMPEPHEDAYTMAASAVLRLIRSYRIDPLDIGFLALGTESSKDQCAGAVIVRGMVDHALEQNGMPRLRRSCEVPEFKQACLGGVYGLKGALRYVASDGANLKAIVVASDIASFERGTSGEPIQGAGAVAMLVEQDPRLLEIDLRMSGSASAYRGPDFRRPLGARNVDGSKQEFPVYSGKYSTFAYLDETMQAFDDLVRKHHMRPMSYLKSVRALFLHRPYSVMAEQGAAFLLVRALAASAAHSEEDASLLALLAARANVSVSGLVTELRATPDLFEDLLADAEPRDPYPLTTATATKLRKDDDLDALLGGRIELGAERMREVGNLYTASLPAWIAAGLEHALEDGVDLTGQNLLALGYGSGDAAEALPLKPVDGWQRAAERIRFRGALGAAVPLDEHQYAALHAGEWSAPLPRAMEGFRISRVGCQSDARVRDVGVDYYEYAPGPG